MQTTDRITTPTNAMPTRWTRPPAPSSSLAAPPVPVSASAALPQASPSLPPLHVMTLLHDRHHGTEVVTKQLQTTSIHSKQSSSNQDDRRSQDNQRSFAPAMPYSSTRDWRASLATGMGGAMGMSMGMGMGMSFSMGRSVGMSLHNRALQREQELEEQEQDPDQDQDPEHSQDDQDPEDLSPLRSRDYHYADDYNMAGEDPISTYGVGRVRRSRRMSNSERGKLYRSRRKEYVESLEQTIDQLKRELEQMRLRGRVATDPARSLVPQRDHSNARFTRIVADYFSVFEYGVAVPPNHRSVFSARHAVNGNDVVEPTQQVAFLRQIASPNMSFGDHYGIDMLFEQWKRYSMYHNDLHFELSDMAVQTRGTEVLVSANAILHVRFSRLTIEKVFPHVLWNESLVQKLVGLEVEYPTANTFYFDSHGKLVRYETEVDFVAAFVRALGSMPTALQIVGKALIKGHHMIGDADSDCEGNNELEHDDVETSGRYRDADMTPMSMSTHRGYGSSSMQEAPTTIRRGTVEWRNPAAVPSAMRGTGMPTPYYE